MKPSLPGPCSSSPSCARSAGQLDAQAALEADIDPQQAAYFASVGRALPPDAKVVVVTHDPEGGDHNFNRWVFGEIEATKLKGWFPLSCTAALEAAEDKP